MIKEGAKSIPGARSTVPVLYTVAVSSFASNKKVRSKDILLFLFLAQIKGFGTKSLRNVLKK
jgi:hypothetical protein